MKNSIFKIILLIVFNMNQLVTKGIHTIMKSFLTKCIILD